MLKIKDDVDLKELEKFGFKEKWSYKPVQDENGKVIRKPKKKPNGEYTKKLYTQWEKANKYYEYIDANEWECWYIETQYHIKEDKIINVYYDTNLDTINETNCDLLYDLIKAGLVEKIND